MTQTWYAKLNDVQGLVIDESTGRTVAVTYDKADAALVAAAPDLLDALREIADDYADRFDLDSLSTNPGIKYVVKQARAAIDKATGEG